MRVRQFKRWVLRRSRTPLVGADLDLARRFGSHVRSLRRARGFTQENFAFRCALAPDTIRRLERGIFAPGLGSIRKVAVGLDLFLSTFFETMELGERDSARELVDLLSTRTPSERAMALGVLRRLFDELDRLHGAREEGELE